MALPPSPLSPPGIGSAGPAGPRTGNPGAIAEGLTQVREAVQLLQMALPKFEVGSEPQKSVLKMIQDGSKIAPPAAEQGEIQQTALAGLQDRAKQSQMLQQVMAAQATGGAGGPPGQAAQSSPTPAM